MEWRLYRVKCEVWNVKWGVGIVECKLYVACEVWSVKCAGRSAKCGVSSVEWKVWNVKC